MPKVFSQSGSRFHFYSREGNPREPVHVHVAKPDADAKFWLRPDVVLAKNDGLSPRELRLVTEIVKERRQEIEDAWNKHFATGNNDQV